MRSRLIVGLTAISGLFGLGFIGRGHVASELRCARAAANESKANMQLLTPPFQTELGTLLQVPDEVNIESVSLWSISPDGVHIALISFDQIWVWNRNSNQIISICPQAEGGDMQCKFLTTVFWCDDEHLLTFESQYSRSESARYSARLVEVGRAGAGTPPESQLRCVIVSINSAQRLLSRECGANSGYALSGRIIGARSIGEWYVVDAQGDVRLYDAFANTCTQYSLMHLTSERCNAVQVRGCSDWFSIALPISPGDTRGTFEFVNISTGDTRVVCDVNTAVNPPVVTDNIDWLVSVRIEPDGHLWPVLVNVTSGSVMRVGGDERWLPHLFSRSSESIIATILTQVPPSSGSWKAQSIEIALRDLLDL